MNYPVTVEQIANEYEKVNGCKVPPSKHKLLTDFIDLLNSAYRTGFAAGQSGFKGAA